MICDRVSLRLMVKHFIVIHPICLVAHDAPVSGPYHLSVVHNTSEIFVKSRPCLLNFRLLHRLCFFLDLLWLWFFLFDDFLNFLFDNLDLLWLGENLFRLGLLLDFDWLFLDRLFLQLNWTFNYNRLFRYLLLDHHFFGLRLFLL